MPFAAKVIIPGVIGKAVLMATLVTVLAITSFAQSIILVLVSATATGLFGILIVIIQVHSERSIHNRIDRLEDVTQKQTDDAVKKVSQQITEAISNGESK